MNIQAIYNDQKAFIKKQTTFPIDFRISYLKKLKNALEKREDKIYDALYHDLNKSKFESMGTELSLIYAELDYFIKNLKKISQPKRVATPLFAMPASSKVHYDPLGMVLLIAPWNYPLQLVFVPLIGAIAAGNTVVVKPSELSVHTSRVVAEIIEEVFETHYVAVVPGDKHIVQELLELRWDLIFFTGSTHVGKIVYQKAAQHLTPVVLELGGKSPCIVDQNTDIALVTKRIVWGKYTNLGQTCIAPDYILIHESMVSSFVQAFAAHITQSFGANPLKSEDYGKIINPHHFQRLQHYLHDAKVISGGEYDEKLLKIAPTLVHVENQDNELMQEEIFGPILPYITFQKKEEVLQAINNREKPLALYIFSNDPAFKNQILQYTSSGNACVNDCLYQIANPHFGFGGVGTAGMGSYHGKFSFEAFSHKKSVMYRANFLDFDFRYPPYNRYSLSFYKKILRWLLQKSI